jgi:hypothetical protein
MLVKILSYDILFLRGLGEKKMITNKWSFDLRYQKPERLNYNKAIRDRQKEAEEILQSAHNFSKSLLAIAKRVKQNEYVFEVDAKIIGVNCDPFCHSGT